MAEESNRQRSRGQSGVLETLTADWPLPAVFSSPAAERIDRKLRLACAFRALYMAGMGDGVAGHVSVRDPEHPDRIWLNPHGRHFATIRSGDLICVDGAGSIVEGSGPVNGSAVAIHHGIYSCHPEVVSVAHCHGVAGRAFAALHRPMLPLNQEACIFFDNHVVFPDAELIDDFETGKRLGEELHGAVAAILVNHGLLTVGESVDSAVYRMIEMEQCCRIELDAHSCGQVRAIPGPVARRMRDMVGNEYSCWFGFQQTLAFIRQCQPEVAT